MKKSYKNLTLFSLMVPAAVTLSAQTTNDVENDSLYMHGEFNEVVVSARQPGLRKLRSVAQNTDLISSGELKRAACCNLGESFTTNPSVEVSYSDAATGARQIKLLGLSGTYVQMMTENIPNFRGAAAPYGLSYLAGPWMHSIQVSKGASSVKSGYESITGQMNIEMLKPQDDQSVAANMYVNHMGKVEANVTGNLHLSPKLSTGLLLHSENEFESHDNNGDGFLDLPKLRQIAGLNRWAYLTDNYRFQAGVKFLNESRESGQDTKHASHTDTPYIIDINTNRWEAFAKNAYIFDQESNANVALILSGSLHDQDSEYGHKLFDVTQKNFYASLMFEREIGELHSISVGLSYNYDHYNMRYRLTHNMQETPVFAKEMESVPGGYLQYTFNNSNRMLVMVGLRYDYSSLYGSMVTPRVHLRWNPDTKLSVHASAGRGFRTPHALVDYSYLFASSRKLVVDTDLGQEESWNTGAGFTLNFDLFGRNLSLSSEYYYTGFRHQAVVDLDSDPHATHVEYINGKSYSHTAQVELTYTILPEMTFSAAYRYTDVKENYGSGYVQKPLTSKSKGLFSFNYAPMMGIWEFDATLAINGGGRMPTPYTTSSGEMSWSSRYKTFPQLNAQITKNFRRWAIYIGGENLTGYRQEAPIIDAANPWGNNFDATMIYAPVHGALGYIGFRYKFTKY